MFFKKNRLKKDEIIVSTPDSLDMSALLTGLTRRHKNVVILKVESSARHVFAQAVGYALVGKLPVVVVTASLFQDGEDILRDNVMGSGLNIKFLVTNGVVDHCLVGDVWRPEAMAEVPLMLNQMMESFGPQCMVCEIF